MGCDNQELKVFIVAREADWGEDDAVVVFAVDESHAEHCARCNSSDFATGEVTITEVAADEEKVILVSNTGHELRKLKKLELRTYERSLLMGYIENKLKEWNIRHERVNTDTILVYGNFDGFSVVRSSEQSGYVQVDGKLMDYGDFEDWLYSIKM